MLKIKKKNMFLFSTEKPTLRNEHIKIISLCGHTDETFKQKKIKKRKEGEKDTKYIFVYVFIFIQ